MPIEWSKARKEDMEAALKRHSAGEDLTEEDLQYIDRWSDIEDFLNNRCFFITVQPTILYALKEVLFRLTEDAFYTLIDDRDILIFFPEATANTVYKHIITISVPSNPDEECDGEKLPFKIINKTKWFVVLAEHLNKSSHKIVVETIAHELAHVYLEHFGFDSKISKKEEKKADNLACKWGFKDEITK